MQLNDILTDTAGACAARWPQPATATEKRVQAETLITQLDALKPALKLVKQEKQECARRFGKAKTDNLDIAPLRQQMQEISQKYDRLEAARKQLETTLLDLFAENIREQLPQQFVFYKRDSSTPMNVREIADNERELWDAYVNSHPCASLYHKYYWRDVVTQSFGHESKYFIAQSTDGTICGVLPLIRLRSRLFGDFAVSMPFFNYGGPLADNDQTTAALLDTAGDYARATGMHHLEIRGTSKLHGTPKLNEWPSRTDKVSMIRRLPATAEALDEEIGAKVRAQIKRGQNENPKINIGGLELLDDFYRVFSINMRDLGTPVYGKQFFRNILTTRPENAHLIIVNLRGKAVAAAFLLGHRDLMEIPWASTLRSVNALNMNMVLYRAVLGFCIEHGFRFFDFGRSTHNSGTFKFKKQWGAEPLQHYWHYWLTEGGALPELKPDSPKFKLLIACWQRLPVVLSRLIGPHIVKYLP